MASEAQPRMRTAEKTLLLELANAVHEMAPPDSQRRISQAVEAFIAELLAADAKAGRQP